MHSRKLTFCWLCHSRWSFCPDQHWPPAAHWQERRPNHSLELYGHCQRCGSLSVCWHPTGPCCHCQKCCPAGIAWVETASGHGWAEMEKVCKWTSQSSYFVWLTVMRVWWICDRSTETWSNLVASMTKGFAGHISSQTVEDQVPAGGARGNGAVIGVEWHTGHLFFMVLKEKKTFPSPML